MADERSTRETLKTMSLSELRDAIKFHQQHINLILLEVDERIERERERK